MSLAIQKRLKRQPNAEWADDSGQAQLENFLCANIYQTPEYAGGPRHTLPALLRGSLVYGWKRSEGLYGPSSHELLCLEHLSAQGMPVCDPSDDLWQHLPELFKDSKQLEAMQESVVKSFAGNSMHAAQVGVALLFALS